MEINPCKCGSKTSPIIDSDDMVPCWMVECRECKQSQHSFTSNWSYDGAVNKWNKENPYVEVDRLEKEDCEFYVNGRCRFKCLTKCIISTGSNPDKEWLF